MSTPTPDDPPLPAAARLPDPGPTADDAPTPEAPRAPGGDPSHDVSGLGYEQARDELIAIVARLEAGQVPLEESMTLWQRGEALAAHCAEWLDQAQAQISDAGVVVRVRDTGTDPDA